MESDLRALGPWQHKQSKICPELTLALTLHAAFDHQLTTPSPKVGEPQVSVARAYLMMPLPLDVVHRSRDGGPGQAKFR